MPIYDYVCRNEECPSVKRDAPCRDEQYKSASKRDECPVCWECNEEMPRAFLGTPISRWRAMSANGVMTNYSMGPSQRADRRHAGWDNGTKVLKPIHDGRTRSDVRTEQRRFTERPTEASAEGVDH